MARSPSDIVLGYYAALGAEPPAQTVAPKLEAALCNEPAEVALFLASYFPSAADLLAHLEGAGSARETDLPAFRDGPQRRWREYCQSVDRRLRDEGEDTPCTTAFGICRRCGSPRVLVTTRQLRRARRAAAFARWGLGTPATKERRRSGGAATVAARRASIANATPALPSTNGPG
jgi:hypothetical protein